jgi:S-methylmethionine-dependent homocysteine/selenocysteine methylase
MAFLQVSTEKIQVLRLVGPDGARTQKHAPCESDSCWHVIWDWIQPSSAILSGCCGLKWWAPEL